MVWLLNVKLGAVQSTYITKLEIGKFVWYFSGILAVLFSAVF